MPIQPVELRHSQLDKYSTCPRMYYFAEVLKLIPKRESKKLTFGRGIHTGLEKYGVNNNLDEALEAYDKWAEEQVVDLAEEITKKDTDSIALGKVLLAEYDTFCKQNETFITVAVEQEFEAPLWDTDTNKPMQMSCRSCGGWGILDEVRSPEAIPCPHCNDGYVPVLQVGRWDGVCRDKYGRLWLREYKSCKAFPSPIELQVNKQMTRYLLAAEQLYDEKVMGVVNDFLRKVDPKRAKTPVVDRKLITRTPQELDSERAQLHRLACQVENDEYFDPNPGMHCGWKCAYQQLCLRKQNQDFEVDDFVLTSYTIREEVNKDDSNEDDSDSE